MMINFTEKGWNDYLYWQKQDKKMGKKINDIIKDIQRNGHEGIGKPEVLKGDLSGWYSRRIDKKNRLVYRITGDSIDIAQCGGHYQDK